MTMDLGVDKSSFDGHVDWVAALERKITWATIRASYGPSADPLHLQEAAAARAAGVHVSPYCYYEPGQGWQKQADVFLASTQGGDLPPLIDLEDYGSFRGYVGIWQKEIKPWLKYVEAAVGIRPWIYTGPNYLESYMENDTDAGEYSFLVAEYDTFAARPVKPLTPLNIVGWQFGDGRDAKYYGFQSANGCALYVAYDLQRFVSAWQSKSAPAVVPITPPPAPVYSKGVAKVNVKIHSGASTSYPLVFPNMIAAGTTVSVLDILQNSGDTWIEIATGQWCAAVYQGQTLIELES